MHDLDERCDARERGLRQDAVAQVDDVAARRRRRQQLARRRARRLGAGRQDRRLEVALHGALRIARLRARADRCASPRRAPRPAGSRRRPSGAARFAGTGCAARRLCRRPSSSDVQVRANQPLPARARQQAGPRIEDLHGVGARGGLLQQVFGHEAREPREQLRRAASAPRRRTRAASESPSRLCLRRDTPPASTARRRSRAARCSSAAPRASASAPAITSGAISAGSGRRRRSTAAASRIGFATTGPGSKSNSMPSDGIGLMMSAKTIAASSG